MWNNALINLKEQYLRVDRHKKKQNLNNRNDFLEGGLAVFTNGVHSYLPDILANLRITRVNKGAAQND